MEFVFSPTSRLIVFLALFVMFVLIGSLKSFRAKSNKQRFITNIIISVLNSGLLILLPVTLLQVAELASLEGLGLFNYLSLPAWLTVTLSVIFLDILIYFQHRLSHSIPLLWRIHRFHHSDVAFDTSTGVRFHPIEIVLSLLLKMIFVVLLGAPVVAVFLFELILSSCSLFNHSNFKLPQKVENIVNKILVTPSLHRVHHSVIVNETNSNFGFSVIWWDKIFSSFKSQTINPEQSMKIGLDEFRSSKEQKLWTLFLQPFR